MPHLFYWIVGDFFSFGFWQFKCHISGNLKSVISQNSIHTFSMTCKGPCHEDSSVNIALPVHPHCLQLFLVFLSQLRDDISAECPASALENLSNTSTRMGQGGILVRCPTPPFCLFWCRGTLVILCPLPSNWSPHPISKGELRHFSSPFYCLYLWFCPFSHSSQPVDCRNLDQYIDIYLTMLDSTVSPLV